MRYRGEIRWVLMTADRESGNGDFIIGFIGSAIDITDRKQAEQALADLARTLEHRVAERHAKASEVETVIRKTTKALFVSVSDNGVGMKKDSSGGLGLIHMRERAESVGGSVEFETTIDGGTIVNLRVPLPKA